MAIPIFSVLENGKFCYILLVIGLVLIIVGLLIIIFWQKGFVRLEFLECPEYKNLYV